MNDVQIEPVGFARAAELVKVRAGPRPEVPLSRCVYIAADGRGRKRGLHRTQLLVGLGGGSKVDHPDGSQTQGPFIKLHLVPPMLVCCLLYFFGTCIFRVKPVYPGTNTVHLQEEIGETTSLDNNFFCGVFGGAVLDATGQAIIRCSRHAMFRPWAALIYLWATMYEVGAAMPDPPCWKRQGPSQFTVSGPVSKRWNEGCFPKGIAVRAIGPVARCRK